MKPSALVTGATGYIGGRLVPELLAAGFDVRCLARDPDRLRDHAWAEHVKRVRGDVLAPQTLGRRWTGIDVAFYLIHSLTTGAGFERTEDRRRRATSPRRRGPRACPRIVYLGGMAPGRHADRGALAASALPGPGRPGAAGVGDPDRGAARRGDHRVRIGVLRDAALPDRAAAGDGDPAVGRTPGSSRSRSATCCATWSAAPTRRTAPSEAGGVFDIGGPDVLTYREMMLRYARVAGLPRRWILLGSGADARAVQPLGRRGHAGPGVHRPAAGGVAAPRSRLRRPPHRASWSRTRRAA